MPMSSSEGLSMFPTDEFDYALYADDCVKNFGVRPRPRWISTEFGGHVSPFYTLLNLSNLLSTTEFSQPTDSVIQVIMFFEEYL